MQFITFRLGDALPASTLRQWKQEQKIWLTHYPKPWSQEVERDYHRRFTWRLEAGLDEGAGCCLFKEAAYREIMQEVLMRFHGAKVEHHAWVIMPNHLHVLFTPMAPLEKLVQAWKGAGARGTGRGGSIWQKGYRDTMIRDGGHFANVVRYIRRNPAKLRPGTFTLWEGSRALAVE